VRLPIPDTESGADIAIASDRGWCFYRVVQVRPRKG
jgi:hypothetical protein